MEYEKNKLVLLLESMQSTASYAYDFTLMMLIYFIQGGVYTYYNDFEVAQ
jgi:hypothetical protein